MSFDLTLAASRKRGALAKLEAALLDVDGHQTNTLIETSASPAGVAREEP